jgi:hypothetical protein
MAPEPTPTPMATEAPTATPEAKATPKADERFPGKGGHLELRKAVKAHEGLGKMPQGTRECLLARLDATAKAVKPAAKVIPALDAAKTAESAKKAAAPTVAPKGTLLIADGKGGTRAATLEEVYAALDAMTAPAARKAA